MTEPYELSDRKADILRALVRHYIRTGEPVGSESLAGATGLRVSSATIRNELAALEELGYLTQPHPSAGRVPTDLAYRQYVDLLPARTKLREPERRAIVHFFDEALADVDAILRATQVRASGFRSGAVRGSGRAGSGRRCRGWSDLAGRGRSPRAISRAGG